MELSARPIDEIVLVEELRKKNMLEAVGGFVRLNQITNQAPTTAHRSYFLEQVKTLHVLREVIKASTNAIEKAY